MRRRNLGEFWLHSFFFFFSESVDLFSRWEGQVFLMEWKCYRPRFQTLLHRADGLHHGLGACEWLHVSYQKKSQGNLISHLGKKCFGCGWDVWDGCSWLTVQRDYGGNFT